MGLQITKLEEILSAHSLKVIVGGIQINDGITKYGFTWEDVKKWHEENKDFPFEESEERSLISKPIWKCPVCDCILEIISLPESHEEYKNGKRSKKVCKGTCKKKPCGYTEYLTQTVEEVMCIEDTK